MQLHMSQTTAKHGQQTPTYQMYGDDLPKKQVQRNQAQNAQFQVPEKGADHFPASAWGTVLFTG
jgi:hypothetical protein